MISSFFRKSEIVLDCFTYNYSAFENAKIDHAIKYMPEWWKKTPSINDKNQPTIKNCVGLLDYYKKGIVIPSWFELELVVAEKNNPENQWYRWNASDKMISTELSHDPLQFEKFAKEDGKNFKINSPWALQTREDLHFLWSDPFWNNKKENLGLTILPAAVNFKYQHSSHISFYLENQTQEKNFYIEPLSPLVMLHPLTEKTIVIKHHLVSKEEWDQKISRFNSMLLENSPRNLISKYSKKIKLNDKIDKINQCPFKK
jgi:hypothetical protein